MERTRLYQLRASQPLREKYEILGLATWIAPGIKCPSCSDQWGMGGESYPTVHDVGSLARKYPMPQRAAVSPEEFEPIRAQLRELVPNGAPVYPGAAFGRFIGSVKGRPLDLVWSGTAKFFMSPEAVAALRKHEVRLPPLVAPEFQVRKGATDEFQAFAEPQLLPIVQLSQSTFMPRRPRCGRCGFQSGAYEQFLIESDTPLPQESDVLRARDFPVLVIVTERFADAVSSEKLRGAELIPLSYATSGVS